VYIPVHTAREKLTLEVMDEENLGKDRSLGHIELLAGDYLHQDENGEYVAHEQKHPTAAPLRLAGHSQSKGTLNYTCSFYPTHATWDPDEDQEETEKASTVEGASKRASSLTTASKPGHQRVLSGASAVSRSETVGTIASMQSSDGDLGKQLEKNELQQVESIPAKKAVEKLKLTVDDLQQYGRLRLAGEEDTGEKGCLSWSIPNLQDSLLFPRTLPEKTQMDRG